MLTQLIGVGFAEAALRQPQAPVQGLHAADTSLLGEAFLQGQKGGATVSGFVLDRQGHIITNNHVVQDADQNEGPIEVVDQDGNRYDAEVVGRSAVYDLAVLHVPDASDLTPAALGSSQALRVGEGAPPATDLPGPRAA